MMRTARMTTAAIGTTTSQVLPAAPDRVQLQFHPAQGAQIISLGNLPTTAAGIGFTLSQSTGPIVLRREEVGDAVTWPWYAVADATGGQMTILEVAEAGRGRR